VSRHRSLQMGLVAALVLVLASASPTAAESAKVVRHGDRSEKAIALTFDDGWSANRTRRVVEILDRHGVTATFFPYATAVELHPDLWSSIADRYPVGNHTLNHVRLTGLPSWRIRQEIDGAHRAFEAATGRQMVRIFRPPFGRHDETVRRIAYRAGYQHLVMWDVDSRDWHRPGDRQVLRRATAGTKGSIVLLHSDQPTTVRVLPSIIRHYQRRGYRFVTVPQMLGMDWQPGEPADGEPSPGRGPAVIVRPSASSIGYARLRRAGRI
jgi:peptidoglycan-N-acetylglucosamine deacetylase